ncbi:MAG: Fe-S-containing hydro-lyase [Chitinivibrionales bacterium]|nr:Fe-S-containing hydro-lyase [Chitinivibrionales bacterium]
MVITIKTPLSATIITSLHAGDEVELSGTIYTARDAAHRRLYDLLQQGSPLPVDLKNQVLYYVGPAPARPGKPIGSAGPTTSARMDPFTPALLEKTGLRAMIGKGERSPTVIAAIKQYGAVYFAAIGGAGALIAQCIKKCDAVCYEDLGPEAIFRLTVEKFPLIVAIDGMGRSLYR